ncbi:ABC transporter permease [Paenibacillus sepulcri]|uniref:ABC transporter permease subunit n=1 Tax=Paenibacillus sepulcri TaxID=359917 RepID=A0ABS7C3C1_9BACL|nr:ABC transporter permease subunit [Paenibacillus sepulcri]
MEQAVVPAVQTVRRKKAKWRGTFPLLVMTVPFFLLVLLFSYVPLWGWSIAFVDYIPGRKLADSAFAGFKYFHRLFDATSDFSLVLRNTLVLSFLGLLSSPIPVVLAIMITNLRSKWFGKFVQTVTSFPNFISWIIIYSVFFSFFSIDDGMLNKLLYSTLHWIGEPSNILADPDWTWWFMTLATIWKTAGWTAIIYISAIAGIDQEQYQAAEVDGANRWQQAIHITIPGIMPTFTILLLLNIGNMLNVGFDQYYVFHNALIHDKIEVIDTYTYRVGLLNMDFSYSTAAGIFKSLVSVILLFTANFTTKRITGKSIL